MLTELCAADGMVIATGGGAVMRDGNRQVLRAGGRVVYLHASVEHQIARTARDRNRPLLQKPNPGQILRDLMALRDRSTAKSPMWWWRPTKGRRAWSSRKFSNACAVAAR